jgi:GNAT superfamily N-acetyltransferase
MGWDSARGESGGVQPFLDGGFHLEKSTVLTAMQEDLESGSSPGFNIRPLQTEVDWHQAVENQVLSREPWFGEAGYRDFRQGQAQRYREMIASGLGAWFGAFTGERLVGDLGIFCSQELARYQSVQTHPDFRRRGIASSLVSHAARYAFDRHQVETLVIVAEADSPAQRLYQAIGFQKTEFQMGTWKADQGKGESGEQTQLN